MKYIHKFEKSILAGVLAAFCAGDVTALALEEVIVTAQKREESSQDIPIAVTAIGAEGIEKLGIQNTSDMTRVAPSLTVIEGVNKTSSAFNIRGIGTNTFGLGIEQAVAMIVDDVAYVQQGQTLANLVDVERIEVLRGPQSTLFGKAASAGVINVTTKKPSEEFEGTIKLTATDEEEHKVLASISGPLSDSVGYRVTGYWSDRDGYIENLAPGQDDLGGEKNEGIRTKFNWLIDDASEVSVNLYYSEELSQCCARILSQFDDATGAPGQFLLPGTPFAVPFSVWQPGITPDEDNREIRQSTMPDSNSRSRGANVRYTHEIGEYSLVSVTAYDNWTLTNSSDDDTSDFAPIDWFSDRELETDFFSQEFRLLSPIGDKYDYLVGFFYSDSDSERTFFRNNPLLRADFDATAKNENVALFGQFNWRFSDATSASVGLRYLREDIEASRTDRRLTGQTFTNDDSDEAVTGKVALQHFINEDVMVFASFSRGYKGQAYDVSNAAFTNGTTPVGSESSDSYELGLKSTLWDQRLQLNLTAYHTIYEDFQAQSERVEGTAVSFQLNNAGELITSGIELESIVLLSEEFTLTLNAAVNDSEINDFDRADCYQTQTVAQGCINDGGSDFQNIDGGILPNSPELKYSVALDYFKDLEDVSFDLFANINYAWQDEVNFNILQNPYTDEDAYGITNLRVGISDEAERYEVSLFVNNVFDENYRSYKQSIPRPFSGGVTVTHINSRNSERYMGVSAKYNF